MKRTCMLIVTCLVCLGLLGAAAVDTAQAENMPQRARCMARELDWQLVSKLNLMPEAERKHSMIITTPVNLNNLGAASPLARQLAEEMAVWFVMAGYRVQEIRKGKNVLFEPEKGELLLTRHVRLLDNKNINSSLILTGTYIATYKHVRFNMRLVHAASNDVLAMSSLTLPITPEMYQMVGDDASSYGASANGQSRPLVRPSVATKLDQNLPQ